MQTIHDYIYDKRRELRKKNYIPAKIRIMTDKIKTMANIEEYDDINLVENVVTHHADHIINFGNKANSENMILEMTSIRTPSTQLPNDITKKILLSKKLNELNELSENILTDLILQFENKKNKLLIKIEEIYGANYRYQDDHHLQDLINEKEKYKKIIANLENKKEAIIKNISMQDIQTLNKIVTQIASKKRKKTYKKRIKTKKSKKKRHKKRRK
jgi:hypothetical protein